VTYPATVDATDVFDVEPSARVLGRPEGRQRSVSYPGWQRLSVQQRPKTYLLVE
jgi:hypothetical protein